MPTNDPMPQRHYRVRFTRGESPGESITLETLADTPEAAVEAVRPEGWPEGVATEVGLGERGVRASAEAAAAVLGLLAVAAVLLVCVLAPLAALRLGSPPLAAGLAVVFLGLWAWVGPRPGPGLVGGVCCVLGFGVLLFMAGFLIVLALAETVGA